MTTEMTTATTDKGARKPKKGAPKGAPKGGKKAAKKGAKAKAPKKEKPTTGQSAPHTEVKFDELNDKELKVVSAINGKGTGSRDETTIVEITKVFKSAAASKAQANSWVRNSLRRLVTGEYIEKTARGVYRMTEKGRKRLQRAEA